MHDVALMGAESWVWLRFGHSAAARCRVRERARGRASPVGEDGGGSGGDGVMFRPAMERPFQRIKSLGREELRAFAAESLSQLLEDEVLGLLENPYCSASLCVAVAQVPRLTAFYSVRARLVAHRATPLAHATKLLHYLYWTGLVRLPVDVTEPAPGRRAIQ